ncbi:MAG: transposase [Planctomycetaceae bacterium]
MLNRAVGRRSIFQSPRDYAAFIDTVAETLRTRPMRICAYCVMPNHWHMVVWPEQDGQLSSFVQHLSNLHVKRWKHAHDEVGQGHLYQGRFKSFPIQTDQYFRTVIRYVERNPLRANLVTRAEDWRWSSLGQPSEVNPLPLASWSISHDQSRHSQQWLEWVNAPQTEGELADLRICATRGRPFGSDAWVKRIASQLDLEATLRPRGRPRVEQRASWAG